jgi:ABC-type Fe3+ transport system substrate-binding protein
MTKLLVLALVLSSSTAFADAKYSRKPTLDINVTLTDRVKPAAPAPAVRSKPAVTADDVMRAQEVSQPFRKEQEGILEKLVRETPDDDPDKADLMLRLAELYAMQHRFWRHKSIAPTMPRTTR